jgi:Ser-tRNA(Ala) deacylase AlaX
LDWLRRQSHIQVHSNHIHGQSVCKKKVQYIARWREIAEEQLGWGDSTAWSDLDFEKLSQAFFT